MRWSTAREGARALIARRADELIRQVCIGSPERGLLLLRVRDEIRMTIDAYKTLYESSVTFGVRKQLQVGSASAAPLPPPPLPGGS